MNERKTTILVVEDDTHLMEGIRDILELNGYDVLTATNGAMGLDVLQAQPIPPDLIVSDIMMPRMNGYDFFQSVRDKENWLAIPFIFLTAKGEREDIRKGKRLGAEDYVVKPFDADDLLIAVSAKLDRKKQLDAIWRTEVSSIKNNILTILNHELRTPLTYVVAYADMLHRDAADLGAEDMRNFLRGINTGASRLRRLVETFILLVELETGTAASTYSWRGQPLCEYDTILYNIQQKFQEFARERNVTLEFNIQDNLPSIRADSEYLGAAIECLVDNGIKFSDRTGSVVLLCIYAQENEVCISVQDHGRGIPPGELGNIFDPFYQINREKYEDQGAGAGLAIVAGVVQMHGGRVSVDSVFGKGSTFVIHLPIIDNTNASN